MDWYKYDTDPDRYDSFLIESTDPFRIVDVLTDGKSLKKDWKPVALRKVHDGPGGLGQFPTLMDYSKIPLVSDDAWRVLEGFLGKSCEPLATMKSGGGRLILVNVLDVIDGLNLRASKVEKNDVTGNVSDVLRYAFKKSLMKGKHIIRMSPRSGSDLLVSEEVRKRIEAAGLKGLNFKPLPMA